MGTAFDIWIEAEEWPADSWSPDDTNSDVLVSLPDGSRWSATFVTFANIDSLRRSHAASGECLGGTYLYVTNMVVTADLRRKSVEAVVTHLLDAGEFVHAFRCEEPPPGSVT